MEGWIKSHRRFQKWEWYSTPNMFHLFHHLLYNASHKDCKWKGIDLKRGQAITGLNSLHKNTGISVRSLRTCINRLKSTGEITVKTTNRHSIITICNYDLYNPIINGSDTQNDKPADKQATSKRQANDNIQEYTEGIKNVKEEKKGQILKNLILEDNLKREKETQEFIQELLDGKFD